MKTVPHETCRRIGHQWDEISSQWDPKFGMTPLVLRCLNCHGLRKDAIDALGNLGYRLYELPEDYKQRAEDLPSRTELRAAWVKRQKKKQRAARRLRSVG